MTFKDTYKKITSSKVFKEFIKNNPSAKLCAGFFIIDFFGNDNKKSIDYIKDDKVFTFDLHQNDEVTLKEDKMLEIKDKKFPKLEEMSPKIKVDTKDIINTAEVKLNDEQIYSKLSKIIAVLQKLDYEGKKMQIWNLTCMLEGLIIINILIDSQTGDILKFERKSMMDLIRKK